MAKLLSNMSNTSNKNSKLMFFFFLSSQTTACHNSTIWQRPRNQCVRVWAACSAASLFNKNNTSDFWFLRPSALRGKKQKKTKTTTRATIKPHQQAHVTKRCHKRLACCWTLGQADSNNLAVISGRSRNAGRIPASAKTGRIFSWFCIVFHSGCCYLPNEDGAVWGHGPRKITFFACFSAFFGKFSVQSTGCPNSCLDRFSWVVVVAGRAVLRKDLVSRN